MRPLHPIIILLCCLLISEGTAQESLSDVQAKIDLESSDRFLRITAFATNTTEISQSLKYTLSVVKTDANGNRNKTDQQGFFILEPQEKKTLAGTTLNTTEEDRTIIFLLIYKDGSVIAKDRIVINGFEGEDELQPIIVEREKLTGEAPQQAPADGVVLRGVVVEDTKTRPGNEFYQMFYSQYLANNINGERIVKITEQIAMGRSTKIQVLVDQDLVMEFFVNPRQEYLKQMADQAVYRVRRYFQNLQTKKNQQNRY
ncbi:curli production assembly/transport protein CsgE [Robertkochia flava]|uniref:curli production assembly/transport protein CsgE n=1 Tax=Robertkochia flava TaxID=3447986 RepID=UPI001CCA46D3|nr:curli production assembly/transport protein CsgE [Robertkochia marina]